jgi:D-alanyl-D-alanine dipeptidase
MDKTFENTVPASEYDSRLERVRTLMVAAGLDFLVVGPSADLTYLTGAQLRPSERMAVLVVPRLAPPVLVVPFFEAASLHDLPPDVRVLTWTETENPGAIAASVLAGTMHGEPGNVNVTVGVGERLWSVFLLRLQAELPRASFTSAGPVLGEARVIKSSREIDLMTRAGAMLDDAFAELVGEQFSGRTEIDISNGLMKMLEARGMEVENPPIVGAGENGASPHHHASGRVLRAGDVVVVDFWGSLHGYFSDCTRTVFVGDEPAPESEERRVYNLVRDAQEVAAAAAKPGMTCEALDAVARDYLTQAGYGDYFIHRLGHGIGLDGHEPPYIVSGNQALLQPGMAFTIEPGLYLPGRFGVRIEDSVWLNEAGAVSFNRSSHEVVVVK